MIKKLLGLCCSFAIIAIAFFVFSGCDAKLAKIELEFLPNKIVYVINSSPDLTGNSIIASFSDGSTDGVYLGSTSVTITPSTFTQLGKQQVNVTYSFNGISKSTCFDVIVISEEQQALNEAKLAAILQLDSIMSSLNKDHYPAQRWLNIEAYYYGALYNIDNSLVVEEPETYLYWAEYGISQVDTYAAAGELIVLNAPGGQGYKTFAGAIAAAQAGDTLILYGNINLGYNDDYETEFNGLVNINKDITIKSYGSLLFKISGIMNWTPGYDGGYGPFASAPALFGIEPGVTLTLINIILDMEITEGVTDVYLIYVSDGAELIMPNVLYNSEVIDNGHPLIYFE
ncbi:MAG: hypothetical protein FWE53_00590 [Firmicutes bacterium]|nr:hypothetical protein [Bacillota bacterium]